LARTQSYRSGHYGLDYLLISSATADIASYSLSNLLFRRCGVLIENSLGHQDHPWRASTALDGPVIDECLLQGM